VSFLDRLRKAGAPAPGAETDRLVLRQLEGRGAGLTQPRHVIHFLYFHDEADARGAVDVIEKAGYQLTVTPPDENIAQWSCARRPRESSTRRRSKRSSRCSSR